MYRVKRVAELLSLSQSKIYELVESGDLPHHKIGGAIRVSEEQLAAFLEKTKREREEPIPAKRKPPRPQLRHVTLR